MALTLMLDASPLGRLVNARHSVSIGRWVDEALAQDAIIYLPEISDYELRRGLLAVNATRSLRTLDEFCESLIYLPIDTAAMRQAAAFWAQAKRSGHLNAHPSELNGDVILAAQAQQAQQVNAVVVTKNVAHMGLFVRTVDWRQAAVGELGA